MRRQNNVLLSVKMKTMTAAAGGLQGSGVEAIAGVGSS